MAELIPSEETKDLPINSNSIETIDGAFLDYVKDLNLHCDTINGRIKVPVIWSTAERSFQIKDNQQIRDKNGSLIPPIISLERVSISKDVNKKGSFQSNVSPGNDRYYITKILNQDKTSNFANAETKRKSGHINFKTSKNNKKIVYQHVALRMPVYITVEYKINILTNYQGQMNDLIQPFVTRTSQNYFIIKKDGYRFEAFMDQNFSQDSITDLDEQERKYKSAISVKVLGQLIGEGTNQEARDAEIKENGFLKIPRENIILQPAEQAKNNSSNISSNINYVGSNVAVKKTYTIGNGTDSTYNIQHNLNTRDIAVTIRENFGSYQNTSFSYSFPTENTIEIDTVNPVSTDSYVVILFG